MLISNVIRSSSESLRKSMVAMRPTSWTAKLKARSSRLASIFMALFVVLSGQTERAPVIDRLYVAGHCQNILVSWLWCQTKPDYGWKF